jgi:bifunctional DNA-binding transcriptional regulator/antitoxin component of YhaV-PrlF toxin-antitoxin module
VVAVPIGPRRLTKVRQVAIPAVLLQRLGLDVGSEVYFDIPDEDPHMIRILPAERVEVAQ